MNDHDFGMLYSQFTSTVRLWYRAWGLAWAGERVFARVMLPHLVQSGERTDCEHGACRTESPEDSGNEWGNRGSIHDANVYSFRYCRRDLSIAALN